MGKGENLHELIQRKPRERDPVAFSVCYNYSYMDIPTTTPYDPFDEWWSETHGGTNDMPDYDSMDDSSE
jgi:hypothetical protein